MLTTTLCYQNLTAIDTLHSAEHIQTLQAARTRGRKVFRAAVVASISGWTLVVFAVLTLLTGIFSLTALLLGIGLLVISIVELRGAKKLRRFDLRGPVVLGFNQLALGSVLSVYGAFSIIAALNAPGRYAEYTAGGGQMAEMLEPIDQLHTAVTVAVYAAVIIGAFVGCGLTALYYFTRRPHLRRHLERTPDWALDAMRAAAG